MTIEAVDTRARGLRPRRTADRAGVAAFVRRLDWLLLAGVGALVVYGLSAIDAITRHDPGGSLAGRQAVYVAGGAIVMVAFLAVDPDVFRRHKRPIYVGTLALMVLVLVAAAATRGSRRWIDIGFFKFQPSEFGKVLFTLF